jgi:cobalamin biosynthesis protein CobT
MADYDDENLDETNGSEQGESDDSTEIDRTDETSGQDEAEMDVEDADSESGEELEERDEEQDAKVLAQLQHQVRLCLSPSTFHLILRPIDTSSLASLRKTEFSKKKM